MKALSLFAIAVATLLKPLALSAAPAPPPPPHGSWGNFVYFYTQGSYGTAQADIDAVFTSNGGASGELVSQGYAFLFAPGTYTGLDLQIGYYTSIMGLGTTPFATNITSVNSYSDNSALPCTGSTRNFWRSAENFNSIPDQKIHTNPSITGMVWAASHGSCLRNMVVSGRLYLSDVGPATGAFAANCIFQNVSDPNAQQGSAVYSGTQQQLLMRNLNILTPNSVPPDWDIASAAGYTWAQTFVGCIGAPATYCGNCNFGQTPGESFIETLEPFTTQLGCTCTNTLCGNPQRETDCAGRPAQGSSTIPVNNIEKTEGGMAEKPFITYDGSFFSLVIPTAISTKTQGTQVPIEGEIIPFTDVYVATPSDTVDIINNMLNTYRAVILTPGTYNLPSPIEITQDNKVLLGIGYPILIPTQQNACVVVGNVTGVRVGGLLLQAGFINNTGDKMSDSLLQWGIPPIDSTTDGFLYDCFARAGYYTNSSIPIAVKKMFTIASSNVTCDNVWAWRADSDLFGPVNLTRTMHLAAQCPNGTVILGNNVIAYGLSCEHMNFFPNADFGFGPMTTRNLLEWYGENGKCYSYIGTFPIDGLNFILGNYGSAGYVVGTKVVQHVAYDVGIYSRLTAPVFAGVSVPPVVVNQGIVVPNVPGEIQFFTAFTRILSGNGTINCVINGPGGTGGGNTSGSPINSFVNATYPGPTYILNCQYDSVVKTAFPYNR